MTMSQSELDSFHNFATNILAHGNRDISLEDLVSQWHSQREHAETLASIRDETAAAIAAVVEAARAMPEPLPDSFGAHLYAR